MLFVEKNGTQPILQETSGKLVVINERMRKCAKERAEFMNRLNLCVVCREIKDRPPLEQLIIVACKRPR